MPARPRWLVAGLTLCLLALAPAGAAARTAPPAAQLRALPGSVLPLLRGAVRLAATPATTPVDVSVALHPRHPALLAYTAAHSSADPLSPAQLRTLFAPRAADRSKVVSYMSASGMSLTSSGLLTMTFHGTAAAAGHAFHVGLASYRGSTGKVFRAASGPVQLPASITPLVSSVSGLDTATKLHRMGTRAAVPHTAVPSGCAGATNYQNNYGGYLPADLAHAYGTEGLITAGSDGSGESIALVEFSDYKASDITNFKSCFGLSTPVNRHTIGGGTTDQGGAIEDELDIEIALAGAPKLDGVDVYVAPNNVAEILPMLEAMRSAAGLGGAHIISDSWGLCEAYLPPSFMQAESDELELTAAAGISFYAASGDDGSSDCESLHPNDTRLVTDDPASQPFATGVGGTSMPSSSSNAGSAWTHGGGGISEIWPQPAYQSGNPVNAYDNGSKCGNTAGFCRQVPDVALDADLNTGYDMYCTAAASNCSSGFPWITVGGTSGAAPLMAAITADANTYSLANGGQRMGFANPFLYSDAGMFTDITTGSNSINGSGLYVAAAGYDPATGLGSPNAGALATDLAAFSPSAISRSASTLAITAPLTSKTITYGTSVTLRGTLTGPGATPIPDRRVFIELIQGPGFSAYHADTDGTGAWSLTLSKAFRRNTHWKAVFPGSDTEDGATTTGHPVYVIPKLGASAPTRATHGTSFTVKGSSTPNMHGVKVQLQERRSTGGSWHTVASVAVGRRGTFAHAVSFSTTGPAYVRWHYAGGTSKPWMAAASAARKVSIV